MHTKAKAMTDYFISDPPIPDQQWCVLSFADNGKAAGSVTKVVKVKYVTRTQEEATRKAEHFQSMGDPFDVYVGEVGKWLPFTTNPLTVGNVQYEQKELSDLISGHLQQQQHDRVAFKERVALEKQRMQEETELKKKRRREDDQPEEESSFRPAPTVYFEILQVQARLQAYQKQLQDLQWEFDGMPVAEQEQALTLDYPKADSVEPLALTTSLL